MIFIYVLFGISLAGLILFFVLKNQEMKSGKGVFVTKALDKSDLFINRGFVRLKYYFNVFVRKLNRIPLFFDFLLKSFLDSVKFLKNKLVIKIVNLLNLDSVKDIEKNKGSVSLFLRDISEDIDNRKSSK